RPPPTFHRDGAVALARRPSTSPVQHRRPRILPPSCPPPPCPLRPAPERPPCRSVTPGRRLRARRNRRRYLGPREPSSHRRSNNTRAPAETCWIPHHRFLRAEPVARRAPRRRHDGPAPWPQRRCPDRSTRRRPPTVDLPPAERPPTGSPHASWPASQRRCG